MSKRKTLKKADEEVLKHYTSYDDVPTECIPAPGENQLLSKQDNPTQPDALQQPHLKKIVKKALASKPKFIKAEIAVDHVMAKRKSAVIKNPSKGKSK